ncbi:GerAB/ArcD/ProY family transporter [Ureibacillus massiliensis]|uniref:GerAB/ArcD/ProY family transporter n=1 Tax=Ureibacillus massiliensis TaxID=292806 RepID=UPI0038B47DDB
MVGLSKTIDAKQNQTINAFLLFYIIIACQVGVGIHGFQRVIYKEAKQDAWISVILIFLFAHLIIFVMIKTLEIYQNLDLYEIHQQVYGKIIGNFFNFIYLLYCTFAFFTVSKNYIEVINTWVFPYLNSFLLTISLLLIVIYAFTGGFRVIVGICVISFFFIWWIPPILFFPLTYSNINYLLPIFEDFTSILKGSYAMSFTIVGFEILNIVYPFVKDNERKKVNKFSQLALLTTLGLYLLLMLVALTYFSGEQLSRTVWATLTMFSIIKLPFVERVEIITICLWLIIILPNLCLYMWAAYRGTFHIFKANPRWFYVIFSIIIVICTSLVNTRTQINHINNIFGNISFYIVFIYPLILFIFTLISKKFRKHRVNQK